MDIKRIRMAIWVAVGAFVIPAAFFGNNSTRIISAAFGLVLLLGLYDAMSPAIIRLAPKWTYKAIGPLTIIVLCVSLYGPLLLGDMPLNHDHPIMLLRAWVTGHEMIPSGHLSGFSTTMFAGHPANALYSMGTDLLVCTVKVLTLGLTSWETAYSWALFLAVLAYPMALYFIGKRIGGPVAGIVAGILGIIDRGDWFQGGWDFNLNWAVWSMGLSFSLSLWALWAFERLARLPNRRWLWLGAALSLGGAIVCHPMAIAIMGISLPLMFLIMSLTKQLQAPGLWLPRTMSAVLVAMAFSAFWLVPFVMRKEWFEPLASPYHPYGDVIKALLDGTILRSMAPAIAMGGIIGLVLGAKKQKPFAMFLLLTTGLLLFVSSDTFLLDFDILKKLPSIGQLQTERFTYFIRAACLLGAGTLVAITLHSNVTKAMPGMSPLAKHTLRFLLGLVLAPVFVYAPGAGTFPWFAPSKTMVWSSDSDIYRDLKTAAEFINAMDRKEIGRIALINSRDDHLLMALPVFTNVPIFKIGFTPENNYRYKFSSQSTEAFRAVGVTHVLSVGPRPRADFQLIRSFGRLYFYRFTQSPYGPFKLEGPGTVKLIKNSPTELDLDISGTDSSSKLIIYRGRYALWIAEQDGKKLPIKGASVQGTPEVFMSIPIQDGAFRLYWSNKWPELLGNVTSILAVLIALTVAVFPLLGRMKFWPAELFSRLMVPVQDFITLATLAALLLAVVGLMLKLLLPVSSPFAHRRIISDLSDGLPQAHAQVIRGNKTTDCRPWDGKKYKCPGPSWNFIGEVLAISDHQLRQCIWLHPIQGARHSITFRNVDLGRFIQGFFALDDRVVEPFGDKHPVNFTVLLDGQELGRFTCQAKRGWQSWQAATPGRTGTKGDITIQSDASFAGSRHFCFTAFTTEPTD